ncbi:hypothetical protein GGF46_003820 [Coemansia sp. RSA 552]|nr:hypothetical protein GGF46_003820 [Coemansia sp. RSA 552]
MVSETKVVPAFLGGFICIYGLISGFVKERLFLSEALVAMTFGIILGPKVINIVDPREFLDTEKFTLEFARYVIAIQVMAAGITLPGRYIVRKWRTMSILLGPVMVVMWLVTAGIVHLMFQISFSQSLLIASCAAPTDPILANSVVKGRYAEANVPKNVRDALSAESGINDGLGLPFLYFALYLLNESYSTRHAIGKWFYWTWCYNIILSVVIGIVVGYVARKLLRLAESYDLIDKESFLAFSIGLSIFIVGCLQLIRSDDVLCCFIAGHSFTWDSWFREETKDAHFQEVLDGLINVTFFIYFGTIIPWDQFNNPELVIAPWRLIVAAIMVLLLRRMPIVLILTKVTPAFRNYRQSLFAGWFGPIGVGAMFFAEIVLEEIEAEPENFHLRSREIIQPIVMFLIFSSVLVHGITIPLMYIGKVVRSRSRSLSTMSIRNGIASRLSFVSSREPTGIHGVQIPMMDEYVDESPKHPTRRIFSTDASGSSETSPADSEKHNGKGGPAAPLDLTRTITIDDRPKVNRDQMDIHYRINQSHDQYHQHVQNLNTPTALHGPDYSYLHGAIPPKSQSAQELADSTLDTGHAAGAKDGEQGDEGRSPLESSTLGTIVDYPRAVRVKSREHHYSGASETYSDTDVMALRDDLRRRSLERAAESESTSGSPPPPPRRAPPEAPSDSDGLILAADEEIASRHASRTTTRDTTVSNPEVISGAQLSGSSSLEISPLSRHSSIPIEGTHPPSFGSAPSRSSQPSTPHRTRREEADGLRRRARRRRQPAWPTEDVNTDGPPACEYVGNHRNPLGRLDDGELVDYDDPNDEDLEVSFMGNNTNDRFIDYLTVDLGSGIRRLRSKLPAIGRRQTDPDTHQP